MVRANIQPSGYGDLVEAGFPDQYNLTPWEERLRPIHDFHLLRPMDAFEDASGLVLPQGYNDDVHGSDGDHIRTRNQLCLGVVVAVGPGLWKDGRRVQTDLEVGEKVMYNRADAKLVKGSDPMLVLVREPAIFLAVVGDVRQVVGGLVTA